MAIVRSGGKIVKKDGKLGDGQGCCCKCKPCPYCDAACVSVTLEGWDCTGVGPDGLFDVDINGTFLLTRGRRRKVPVTVVTSTGSGAILWAVLGWNNDVATNFIAGVDIENGGVDYAAGDTAIVDGDTFPREEICGKTPHVEITVEDGVIVSAEVTDPGEFVLARERSEDDPNIFPRWSCIYSRCDLIESSPPLEPPFCRYITLEVTDAQRILTVTFGDPLSLGLQSVLLRGVLAADETPCDGLEFTADDFDTESLLHPCAVGTAVVEPADCEGPPPEECCVLGSCCIPLCCVFKGDVVWAPNDGEFDPDLVFNEETGIWEPEGGWLPLPPELDPDGGVPGYVLADGPPNLGHGYYRGYCPDVECDPAAALADFTAAVQAVDPYAGTKWEAHISPVSGQGSVWGSSYLNGTEEGVYCGGTMTQAQCEEVRGEYLTDEECSYGYTCGYFACCLPDGSCVSVHPHDCEQMGGTRGTDRCENYDCENPFP